jgi:hypothetical protein
MESCGYVVVTDARLPPRFVRDTRRAAKKQTSCGKKAADLQTRIDKYKATVARLEAERYKLDLEQGKADRIVEKARLELEAGSQIANNRWAYVGTVGAITECGTAVTDEHNKIVGYTCVGLGVCSTRCVCV